MLLLMYYFFSGVEYALSKMPYSIRSRNNLILLGYKINLFYFSEAFPLEVKIYYGRSHDKTKAWDHSKINCYVPRD